MVDLEGIIDSCRVDANVRRRMRPPSDNALALATIRFQNGASSLYYLPEVVSSLCN